MNPLRFKSVCLSQDAPLHTHDAKSACVSACTEWSDSYGTATYCVDLDTGACLGVVSSPEARVDPIWWEQHCKRIGFYVKELLEQKSII